MRYGKIVDDKLIHIISTNDSERGYSGVMFYNDDGTFKNAAEIIAEQKLKPINVAVENKYPINLYTFIEQEDSITVTGTLTAEAEAKISNNNKQKRIGVIQKRLNALTQDIVQASAGEIVPNIEERKIEFITLHNELRELKGLPPRETGSSF